MPRMKQTIPLLSCAVKSHKLRGIGHKVPHNSVIRRDDGFGKRGLLERGLSEKSIS